MQPDTHYQRILLIEDNDIDVELISRIAHRSSIDVPIVRARNGLEALEILNQPDADLLSNPYLVLLDINMPLMTGFEFLEHLDKNGPKAKLPIYILSSSEAETDKSKAEKFAVSGYLVKPLSIDSLSAALAKK